MEKGRIVFETVLMTADGRRVPFEFNSGKITFNGRHAVMSIARDITERKRMEAELKEYAGRLEEKVADRTADLEAANLEIKKLLDVKTQFISQLSHDLRTPLTPVIALMPQIEANISDPQVMERFVIVKRNVEYIRKLVTDTLNLAKMESGSMILERKKVNLRELAETIVSDHLAELEKAGLRPSVSAAPDICVDADELRLSEVLGNIIGNAIKYSPSGGALYISAARTGDEVEAAVKDEGIGLEEKELEKIFQEFYKVDSSRHDLMSTGLGLAICQRIVEAHGGRIWAESEGLGKGTTIKFTLPAAKE
jgi:signal transduction histidine kinase